MIEFIKISVNTGIWKKTIILISIACAMSAAKKLKNIPNGR
jgi:hypothetical protein